MEDGGYKVLPSVPEALRFCEENYRDLRKVFFIGGNQIYAEALPIVDALYLTQIEATFPGADTFFPRFAREDWLEVERQKHSGNAQHVYPYTTHLLIRKERIVSLLPKHGSLMEQDVDYLDKYPDETMAKNLRNELRYYFGGIPPE